MKYILSMFIALCMLTPASYAQHGLPFKGGGEDRTGFGMHAGMQAELSASGEAEAESERPHLSHDGLFGPKRNTITSSGVVSPVWAGSMSQLNFAQSEMTSMQFSTGFLAMTQRPASNVQGNGLFASVVPMFFGVRQDLLVTTTRSMEWKQYAVAGAGPMMGIEHPEAASFWQTFSRMSFRWGAGAYAGLGSEMRFERGVALYAQLELTGFGFTAPLYDRKSYLGPSISFGIMFFPQ